MKHTSDVHQQFAECFSESLIQPYAYLLSKRMEEGHICIPLAEINEAADEIPESLPRPSDLKETEHLISNGDAANTPFVLHKNRLYLQRYFNYETHILQIIKEKLDRGDNLLEERKKQLSEHQALIETLSANYSLDNLQPVEKTDWQLVAVLQSLLHDFSIITGGPGTGKTTTLGKLLRILYAMQPDALIALAAPTGKAAMRMHESLQISCQNYPDEIKEKIASLKPSTIHSLLGYIPGSVNFKHNELNPLPFDLVVVDEASMIDITLFAKLLKALGNNNRIILLGDKDQLASVEAGSLLGDLCQSVEGSEINQLEAGHIDWINRFIPDTNRYISHTFDKVSDAQLGSNIIELKLSHRFKKQGVIGQLSQSIIRNDTASLQQMITLPPDTRLKFDHQYDINTLENFIAGYENYISEPNPVEALKKLNQLRVLVTVREGKHGLYAINRKIEEILKDKGMLRTDREFYENRPVIVTRNNYELGLFNGDLGIVRKINGQLRVCFEEEGKIRSILPAYLSNCETVFAMTIHKSQGSEFNHVMIVLPEGTDNPLLTRELLYTGVTRARDSVTIQGSEETILHAASQQVKRLSGISERINAL